MGKSRQTANLVSDNIIYTDIVNDRVGIKTDSPRFSLEVGHVGASGTTVHVNGGVTATTARIGSATTFTEDLVVQGDARVTGILTIGTGSITIDPTDNAIKLTNDAVIRRDESTGDIRFLDTSGNLKKIIASEIRVGSGDSISILRSRSGKLVVEDSVGTEVSVASTWTTITSNTSLVSNSKYFVDTSSGIVTMTLPQSPNVGDYITLSDASGSFSISTCFIQSHGSATGPSTYIQGSTNPLQADVQFASFTLTYTGISTTGWLVK